jgi:hypothetical protein
MKRFVEIDGFVIAVNAIAEVHPPGKDGKTFIDFVDGNSRSFSEESVAKLRTLLDLDCTHL